MYSISLICYMLRESCLLDIREKDIKLIQIEETKYNL